MKTPSRGPAVLIDAGNSKVRFAAWHGGAEDRAVVGRGPGAVLPPAAALTELGVLGSPRSDDTGLFESKVQELLAARPGQPVVLVSVVPAVVRRLRGMSDEVIVVDHTSALPFGLNLPDPGGVGPDRLCNIAAAAASGCRSALVVDAGTATTFDLLLDGEFAGGLIAPGMAFAAARLAETAARLFPVPFAPCALEPGRDTAAALQAGCFHVGLGGVESVLEQLLRRYGPLPVVVTGGLGHLLAHAERLYDPDWTLRGAASLAGLGA